MVFPTRKTPLLVLPLFFLCSMLPLTGAMIVDTDETASIEISGGVSYTAYADLETNVSLSDLIYTLSSDGIINSEVSVWTNDDYAILRGTTNQMILNPSSHTKDISSLPFGRYVSIEVVSQSKWLLEKLDLETATGAFIGTIAITDLDGQEKISYGREEIVITAEVLSPGGPNNIQNTVRITITDPNGDETEYLMDATDDMEFGTLFEYIFEIPEDAIEGEWTISVTGEDDSGDGDTKEITFWVKVPTATISISSVPVYDDDDLICNVTPYSSSNNGNIMTSLSWFKNGVDQTSLATNKNIINGSKGRFVLEYSETEIGQEWKCVVVLDDGFGVSEPLISSPRSIRMAGSDECTDSDGGKITETRGLTSGLSVLGGSIVELEDTCSGKILTEYYCSGTGTQTVANENTTCMYYCINGACNDDYDPDNDGYTLGEGDCDNNDKFSSPGSKEICGDNKDNDCDGSIDESDCGCRNGDIKPCGSYLGECKQGISTCVNNVWSSNCVGGVKETTEICDSGLDEDCDGKIDEDDCICKDGKIAPCGSSVGECNPGTKTCVSGSWTSCSGSAHIPPTGEVCDGKDNDCDGVIDNDCVSESNYDVLCANGVKDPKEDGIDCGGVCPVGCSTGEDNTKPTIGIDDDVLLWISVTALGLLIMGVTGVYIMFAEKKKGGTYQ